MRFSYCFSYCFLGVFLIFNYGFIPSLSARADDDIAQSFDFSESVSFADNAPFADNAIDSDEDPFAQKINIDQFNLRDKGFYVGFGAQYLFRDDIKLGAQNGLVIKHDEALYYQIRLGQNLINLDIKGLRYDIEFYFGKHDVAFKADDNQAMGDVNIYGVNINGFYDFLQNTLFTPYIGASGIFTAMRLRFDDEAEARALAFDEINGYLDNGRQNGFNFIFGYALSGGILLKLGAHFGVNMGYQWIQYQDCAINEGCGLLKSDSIHKVAADIMLRF